MSGRYQDLRVWQEAMALAKEIYIATERLPKHELYGLTSQMRRAAVSVASNIAEGKGRRTDKEFCHFLYTARGSLFEIETQVQLGAELRYFREDSKKALMVSVSKVARSLTGLIHAVEEELVRGAGAR